MELSIGLINRLFTQQSNTTDKKAKDIQLNIEMF